MAAADLYGSYTLCLSLRIRYRVELLEILMIQDFISVLSSSSIALGTVTGKEPFPEN